MTITLELTDTEAATIPVRSFEREPARSAVRKRMNRRPRARSSERIATSDANGKH